MNTIRVRVNYDHHRIGMNMSTNNQNRHVAIILSRKPSHQVLTHLFALLGAGVDTFVMCDNQPSTLTSMNQSHRIIYVNNTDLARFGMSRNQVWDRVFVWLYDQTSIDFVWVMEEDVTWIHINDMLDLFNKYATNRTDLLSRNIIYRNNQTLYWMWWPRSPLNLFPQHMWAGSLNMLVRVSRRLIDAHQHYTRQLFDQSKKIQIDDNYRFQEFFIPTVAHMQNLTMAIYDHSKMNVRVGPLNENDIRRSIAEGTRIFHAVKHDSKVLDNTNNTN